MSEPVTVHRFGDGPVLVTCEHASGELPEPWGWSGADSRLVQTHWAVDLGAGTLAIELAEALQSSAVIAGFSRLLVDANRDLDSATLFRTHCDGVAVDLNTDLAEDDRSRRLAGYYAPFHEAARSEALRVPRRVVFSVHSFTPEYEGQVRTVEVGVLFDRDESAAIDLRDWLARELRQPVALNEPWSGRDGLMFSPTSHADACGALALEIEVRQDLLPDPEYRRLLVAALAGGLMQLAT